MAKSKEQGPEVDVLLKKVLRDDLTPATERKLKAGFVRFKRGIAAGHAAPGRTVRGIRRGLLRPGSWGWLRWIVSKEALAFSSMIMIAIGGFLQVSGQPGPMAEALSLMKTSFSVVDRLGEARSMECRLRAVGTDGRQIRGAVLWSEPAGTRAEISGEDGSGWSVWRDGREIIVANQANGVRRTYGRLEEAGDPLLVLLKEFLSPGDLAEALRTKWVPGRLEERTDGRASVLIYQSEGGRATLEMSLDPITSLPSRIKRSPSRAGGAVGTSGASLDVRFVWNTQIPPGSPALPDREE